METSEKLNLLGKLFRLKLYEVATDNEINPIILNASDYCVSVCTKVRMRYLNNITNKLISVLGFEQITDNILDSLIYCKDPLNRHVKLSEISYNNMEWLDISYKAKWIEIFYRIRKAAYYNSCYID